jgi:dCTP deaminase
MVLSDRTIKKLIAGRKIIIDPYEERNVQSASVDLRLGNEFLIPDYHQVELISIGQGLNYRKENSESIIIPPQHFILGTTLEYIEIENDICARLDGKSGIGRTGLSIETAGHVGPGFKGRLTLEFKNQGQIPIKLFSGIEICQIIFQYMDNAAEKGYSGKYQGQDGVTGSK